MQYYSVPLESIYFKATPNIASRRIIQSLLTNEDLIPAESLYRPDDVYFGKAKDIRYVHAYGLTSSTIEKYTAAMQQNHYNRKLILGPLKTAIARDAQNNIQYEVVYSEIIDELANSKGLTPPQNILWPRNIELDQGPWTINNSDMHVSFSKFHTNLSPGRVHNVYPAGLNNMRTQVTSAIGQDSDVNLLPLWMTSQQRDGNTIGFTQAWVLCYTLPNMSETVKSNIEANWPHTLNEIDFSIDRYIVDKSATYNWNNNLTTPSWSALPSAVPTPNPMDSSDITVLFPKTTILPKDIDY